MNVTFSRCRAQHIALIKPAGVQLSEYAGLLTPEAGRIIEASTSFSAWRSGLCIGAGGLISHWPGRAEAWLLVGERARPVMRPLVRFMRTALDNTPTRRVELTVLKDNPTGHKFADLLGFRYEAELEAYHPSGATVVLYKRIKQ